MMPHLDYHHPRLRLIRLYQEYQKSEYLLTHLFHHHRRHLVLVAVSHFLRFLHLLHHKKLRFRLLNLEHQRRLDQPPFRVRVIPLHQRRHRHHLDGEKYHRSYSLYHLEIRACFLFLQL
jgi:hypothetical protein